MFGAGGEFGGGAGIGAGARAEPRTRITPEQIAAAVRNGLLTLPPGAIRAEMTPHTAVHAASEGGSYRPTVVMRNLIEGT